MRRRRTAGSDGSGRRGRDAQPPITNEDIVEACKAVLFAIAMDPEESGSTRVAAITRLLDREIGKPVQPNPNLNKSDVAALSDDELRDELARLEEEVAGAHARAAGTATPE
jgi:hypothetical protein